MKTALSISEVSEKLSITPDALRYYEKIGMAKSHRRESGIRYYDENDISRLEFIKCMRDAGISIEALNEYLTLLEDGEKSWEQRKAILVEQRDELLKKKEAIDKSLARLNYKIDNYETLFKGKK